MANQEHLDILKQGVEIWNQLRKVYPEIQPYLRDADLSHADLRGAYLSHADLHGADLRKADLRDADLRDAHLSLAHLDRADLQYADIGGAYLSGTHLCHADLCDADLSLARLDYADLSDARLNSALLISTNLDHADLRHADLCNADLHGAHLRHTNLSGAKLNGTDLSNITTNGTIFAQVDLRETRGLAAINHGGPSRVEFYTVQLPQDGSALHFLRGAGVPDEWIDDYRMHMMSPIQYHSLFISYSSKDDILARRLHADLQDHGVRCWFAPEDLKIGDKIRARIDEAIHMQDKLLLLLSKHAIESSWVEDEVEAALEKEQRQQRGVLFPVRLDEQVMQTTQSWATKLRRTRHIGDFTHWTDAQAYQQAFERLLRDLKTETEKDSERKTDGKSGTP